MADGESLSLEETNKIRLSLGLAPLKPPSAETTSTAGEDGDVPPDDEKRAFDNLKALSEALQVTTDYLLGRVDEPGMMGVSTDKLFRHAENMSSDDLDMLTGFAEMLAKKAAQKKKE